MPFAVGVELFGPVRDQKTGQYVAMSLGAVTLSTGKWVTCGSAVYNPGKDHIFLTLAAAQIVTARLNLD
jgi:hypothetical protein